MFKSKSDRQFDSFLRVAGRNKRLSSHASIQNWLFNDHLASYASYFLDELILNSASFEREVKSYFPSWIELLRYTEIIFEEMWKDVEGHWYTLDAREDVCPWSDILRISRQNSRLSGIDIPTVGQQLRVDWFELYTRGPRELPT